MQAPPTFDATFRADLLALLTWRRDVRQFRPDPVPEELLARLFAAADLAPSVGLSEPWRLVRVDDPERRATIRGLFKEANAEALAARSGDEAERYARLKLAGLEAPVHIAVFADHRTSQGGGLGRRTMPETLDYSAVLAIHTLWLVARSEGLGLGWVSILDPAKVKVALAIPSDWRFVGYLCIGYSLAADDTPELERAGWERRQSATERLLRR